MIMSIRVGTNDLAAARHFYDGVFLALGGERSVGGEDTSVALYRLSGGLVFIVGPAANGEPATFANGGTILFTAKDAGMVDTWHAAGLARGGVCEGAPGPRAPPGAATAPICGIQTATSSVATPDRSSHEAKPDPITRYQ
jgi:catechol 2,3-dioxygenase-like lactoylglutathione lyase family enzyme